MTVTPKQIKRLRTYSDDVASIRGTAVVPTLTTPVIKKSVERMSLTKSSPSVTLMPPANIKTPETKKSEPVVIKKAAPPVPPPVTPRPITATIPSTPAVPKVTPQKITPTVEPPKITKPKIGGLQEEISLLNKNQPASILTTSTNQLNVEEGSGDGSIVTDRKKDTFNVFIASWRALGTWLDEKFRILEPEKSTKGPTVRPVESRREVITKAASQGVIAPRGDMTTVTPTKPATPPSIENESSPVITIKKAEAVPPSSWSHFKEAEESKKDDVVNTGVEVTERPSVIGPVPTPPAQKISDTEPVTSADKVILEKKSANEKTQTPISKTTEVYVKAQETIVPKATPSSETVSATAIPEQLVKVPEVAPTNSTPLQSYTKPKEPIPSEVTPPPEPVKVPDYAPRTIVEEETKPEKEVETEASVVVTKPLPKPVRFATPKPVPFPIIRVSIIAVTSIVFGISLALWLFGGDTEPNQPIAGSDTESVALVSPDQKTDVLVTNNRDSFLESITNANVSSGSSVTLLQPKMNLNGTSTIPPAATILEILSPRWPGSFTRAVEEINFGQFNGKSFIVMRVTSFELGFSGLLSSESTLVSDFEPLFGTPVSGTFDLSARTVGNIVDPYFVDSNVKNHDVRILRDELQKERLVYGFINRDTIVIAPDSVTFEAVADKIK